MMEMILSILAVAIPIFMLCVLWDIRQSSKRQEQLLEWAVREMRSEMEKLREKDSG